MESDANAPVSIPVVIEDDGYTLHFLSAGTHELCFDPQEAVLDIHLGTTEGKAAYVSRLSTPTTTHAQTFSYIPAGTVTGARLTRSGASVLMTFRPSKLRIGPVRETIDALDLPIWNQVDTGMVGAGIVVKDYFETPNHTVRRLETHFLRDLLSIRLTQIVRASKKKIRFSSSRPLQKALEFIAERQDTKVSLDEIAAAAGVSPNHFAREFRAVLGISAKRYLLLRRIERAQDLIATTDMSLAEIAYGVGFSSQSHMTTAFTNAVGRTPASFRENRLPVE